MAINLRDYSRTAAQRGWGAGWPSCDGAKTAGTAVVTADRSGTRFSVHKRIARLVDLIVDECERRSYLLKAGQTGGYNCRAIGGTTSPSNHSWGLAIDINWGSNPMRRPLTTDIPDWMVDLFGRYGFAWGGDYGGTPDAMHFEFMGTPGQADEMTALALRELTAPAPPPAPREDVMELTDLLPDRYKNKDGSGLPPLNVGDQISHGTAHAAHARDWAKLAAQRTAAANLALARVEAALDRLDDVGGAVSRAEFDDLARRVSAIEARPVPSDPGGT